MNGALQIWCMSYLTVHLSKGETSAHLRVILCTFLVGTIKDNAIYVSFIEL